MKVDKILFDISSGLYTLETSSSSISIQTRIKKLRNYMYIIWSTIIRKGQASVILNCCLNCCAPPAPDPTGNYHSSFNINFQGPLPIVLARWRHSVSGISKLSKFKSTKKNIFIFFTKKTNIVINFLISTSIYFLFLWSKENE